MVGGGFAGIEVFAELRSFASALIKSYPQVTFEDTHFHLIEAMGRIMPEVSLKTSEWVLKDLAKRGAYIHLDTQVQGAVDGNIQLSTGETIPSDLIIWTAGVMANPTVVRGGDLPVEERGRIQTRADLRVGTEDEIVEGAWAAGDVSAVPDLSGGGVGGYCVPNAQHAVRQAKLLAKNITAVLRGELPREYYHKNMGAVAGLGLYNGVFQSGNIALKGLVAWVAHRGYHGLAMPSWERKFRVIWGWWNNLWLGRDIVNLQAVQNPRYVFEEFAARPRPAQPPMAAETPAPRAPEDRTFREKVTATRAGREAPSRGAPVAQPAEAGDLKSLQSGFESQRGYAGRLLRAAPPGPHARRDRRDCARTGAGPRLGSVLDLTAPAPPPPPVDGTIRRGGWTALTRRHRRTSRRRSPPSTSDALRYNALDLLVRSGGVPIRVASKSIRVREVLDAALAAARLPRHPRLHPRRGALARRDARRHRARLPHGRPRRDRRAWSPTRTPRRA